MSKAVKLMQEEDLNAVLKESRDWNKTHELTGMLLYIRGHILSHIEGRFIQVIEGPEDEVKYIFERINKDKRHQAITVLKQGVIKKRNFENWQMGFESLFTEEFEAKEGHFELNDAFLESGKLQRLNVALSFLKSFYNMSLPKKDEADVA
ncbi:hypothetical protein A0256_04175 [Mucilaginibacter sp. PAMC 26640]|nr:hypothetical protein A0256_04175 [Mucilaginibacter sp. PAMC 26640]